MSCVTGLLIFLCLTVASCWAGQTTGYGYGYGYGIQSQGGYYGSPMEDEDGFCRSPSFPGLAASPAKMMYQDGETVEITCKDGYELRGNRNTSTCRVFGVFGRYGVFMPALTPSTCRELPLCKAPLAVGVVVTPQKSTYEIGDNITVTCEEGFEHVGDESYAYTCKKNSYGYVSFGVSSFRLCREIRDCPAPNQKGLRVEPVKAMYKPGEEISLSCKDGYELTVADTSVCEKSGQFDFSEEDSDENVWNFIFSASVCKKKTKCKAPDSPGLIVTPMKDSYASGEEITLSCEDDYELRGPNSSTCGYGDHTDLQYDPFNFMNDLSGRGRFRPKLSSRTCVPKPRCRAPSSHRFVLTPDKNSYMVGESVEVSCADGYELVSNTATITCERSSVSWLYSDSGFSPNPKKLCKRKESCWAPRERGLVLTPEKTAYDIGEVVDVSCAPGYQHKKVNQSVCRSRNDEDTSFKKLDGKFFPEIDEGDICERIPSCDRPSAEALVLSPDKEYYDIGDKVDLSCEEGYEQRVAPTSTCMRVALGKKGEFDPSLKMEPCRKRTSCEPPSDENLIVSPMKESYAEGEEITLSCKEGYTRVAAESLTCERARHCKGAYGRVTGCFHPFAPRVSCIKTAKCEISMQDHMVVSPEKESYETGDMISVSCEEGYELASTRYQTLTCGTTSLLNFRIMHSSAGFRPRLPRGVCQKRPTCDAPDAQPGLIVMPQKDKHYLGETVQLSCDEGYELTGDDSAKCVMEVTHIRLLFSIMREKRMTFEPKIEEPACKKIETDEEAAEAEEDEEDEEEEGEVEPTSTAEPTTTEPTPGPNVGQEEAEEEEDEKDPMTGYEEDPMLPRETKDIDS